MHSDWRWKINQRVVVSNKMLSMILHAVRMRLRKEEREVLKGSVNDLIDSEGGGGS